MRKMKGTKQMLLLSQSSIRQVCLLNLYPAISKPPGCDGLQHTQEAPKDFCLLTKSLRGMHSYEKRNGCVFIQMWG